MGWIGGGALLTGENGDVQLMFCIEGCKDGGTQVAASLENVSFAAALGEQFEEMWVW